MRAGATDSPSQASNSPEMVCTSMEPMPNLSNGAEVSIDGTGTPLAAAIRSVSHERIAPSDRALAALLSGITSSSTPKRPVQERLAAPLPLDLAARGPRERRRPDCDDCSHLEPVMVSDCFANGGGNSRTWAGYHLHRDYQT